MTYMVQAKLIFQNASRRDTVSTTIQTRIAQTAPYGTVTRVNSTEDGKPAVTIAVAFKTKPEADSFWADAVAFVGTGVNGPVVGSSMWRHDCPRDEVQTGPCVISDRVEF